MKIETTRGVPEASPGQTGAWPAVAFLLPTGNPMLSQATDLSVAEPITASALDEESMTFLVDQGIIYWEKLPGVLMEAGAVWARREGEARPTRGTADQATSDFMARWLMGNADCVGGGFGAAQGHHQKRVSRSGARDR